MKQLTLAAAALACLPLVQCGSNTTPPAPAEQLPPVSGNGLGTFGCLVNGSVWLPATDPFAAVLLGPPLLAKYEPLDSSLSVKALRHEYSNGTAVQQGITLRLRPLAQPGRFVLTSATGNYAYFGDDATRCYYYPDATHPATLTITRLDQTRRIVSGTFSFTFEQTGCGLLEVTDGRFDARY